MLASPDWLPGLIDVFMDGASALAEHELMLRHVRGELEYLRLQVQLAPAPPDYTMDDVAPPTIAGLQKLGAAMFESFKTSGALQALRTALAQPMATPTALGFAPDTPGPRL